MKYPVERVLFEETYLIHPETNILALEFAIMDCEEELLPGLRNFIQDFPFINSGNSRAVFRKNQDWVIKYPLSLKGILDNRREALFQKNYSFPLAKAHFELVNGIQVLIMEFIEELEIVRPSSFPDSNWAEHTKLKDSKGNILDIPEWVHNVDCMQVGLDKKGRLVAFDFAG